MQELALEAQILEQRVEGMEDTGSQKREFLTREELVRAIEEPSRRAPQKIRLPWLILGVGLLVVTACGVPGGDSSAETIRALKQVVEAQGAEISELKATLQSQREREGLVRVGVQEDSLVVEAAKKLAPSVVTVTNTMVPQPGRLGRLTQETARGSGVMVDARGYILTNEHVVRGASDLSVLLHDGQKHPARLIGSDAPFTDLAVIKVDGEGFPVAEMGDSDALVPGQRVIAIGSALGDFRNTVTLGIVSGLHRTWKRDGITMEDLIQTDAAINHGNSGGALANILGQVVGINTSVIRSTGAGEVVEGIGFAIPSNTAQEVVRQLIETGKVARPFLGISHQQITPALAAFYDLPIEHGVYITGVSSRSPAALAGLQENDIITKIGPFPMNPEHPFLNVLMKFRPGQTVTVTFVRNRSQLSTQVTFADRPS